MAALAVAGFAATAWVFAPVLRGPEAARRDLGTHRLVLGAIVAVLWLNAIIVAPLVGLLRGEAFTASTFVIAAFTTDGPMLLVLYVRLVRSGAVSWHDLGIRRLPAERVLRVGLATGFGGLALSVVIGLLLNQLGLRQNQLDQFSFVRDEGPAALLATLVVVSGVAPFVEELFFRGFVFGLYRRRQPAWVAYGASSLLFATLHVSPRAMALNENLALLVGVFALGLLLAWTYDRTGSILPGVVAHAVNNTVALAAVYSLPAA